MFENRVAVVTGASKGIGFAVAHELARQGADVFLVARDQDRLAGAAARIARDTGRRAAFAAADLATEPGCTEAADAAVAAFGGVDILVNNAGAARAGRFTAQPDADWIDGFALKFHGAVRLTRRLWPELVRRSGSVVNVGGGAARTPAPGFLVAGAVNAALANFTKGLAALGIEEDVNVNIVHPGMTVTERMEDLLKAQAADGGIELEAARAAAIAREGVRRLGEPEDVAALVAFLCSPAARHIQGAAIAVDGGATRGVF